jgi:hypothetical protein
VNADVNASGVAHGLNPEGDGPENDVKASLAWQAARP